MSMGMSIKAIGVWLAAATTIAGQVLVLEPPEAATHFNHTVVEGATATFGAPYYGERVEGELLFFDVDGCASRSYELPPQEGAENTSNSEENNKKETPMIVMVRRGGCNFVNKVRVAQEKGAKAVIIGDKGSGNTREDIARIIVADDGWGENIKIPSILLSEQDSNALIAAGDGNLGDGNGSPTSITPSKNRTNGRGVKSVIVELVWALPKDHAVQVDMWLTPSSSLSAKFIHDFARYADIFKHKVDFQPHYWVLSLSHNYHDMCTDETADFCAFDPDFDSKVTGKMILEESVRQLCLWNSSRSLNIKSLHSGFYSSKWWEYMRRFPEECPQGESADINHFGEQCSLNLMKRLAVNLRQVKKCYKEHFTTYLAHELVNRSWSPAAILVNRTRYSGPLDAELVARAICTAFVSPTWECTQAFRVPPRRENRNWAVVSSLAAIGVVSLISLLVCLCFQFRNNSFIKLPEDEGSVVGGRKPEDSEMTPTINECLSETSAPRYELPHAVVLDRAL